MEFQELLSQRRSIRRYIDKPVEKEKITEMIEAAIQAPSWKNSQVTRYHVITHKETLEQIKLALPEFNQKNVTNAPVIIISTIILNRAGFERDGTPTNELENGWGYYDCGLHNMNLLLKATDLGLSTLVMGLRDSNKIKDILHIDNNESIVSVISVGYSDFKPEKPKRKQVEDITTFYE